MGDIYNNLKLLCKEKGKSINTLEKELGFGRGSLSKIDKHKPGYEKLKALSQALDVRISDITGEPEINTLRSELKSYLGENEDAPISEIKIEKGFYLDQDALDLMQIMADRPEYKTLFKAAANVKPEDIEKVKAVLDAFKKDDYAE